MTTAYTAFYNYVCPDVPSAPIALVQNAIRDAVIELCERGLIWRQELQQIFVLAPTATTTTVAQVIGDTQVTVADTTNFANGDTITVDLDDGTKWRGHVSGTPAGGVITLDGQLNQIVDIGAAVTKLVYIYTITLPANTAIVKATRAWLNDAPIDPLPYDDQDTEFNNTDFHWVGQNWRTDVNLPTRFTFSDDNTLNLLMPAATTGNLRIEAALKPTRASTGVADWIYERYVTTVAHGAKAKLMLVPKKPYSDAKLGAYHESLFNDEVGDARVRSARGNTRGPLRTHTVFGLR